MFLVFFLTFGIVGCTDLQETVANNPKVQEYDSDIAFNEGKDLPPTAKTLYSMAEILSLQGRDSNSEIVLKQCINDYPNFTPAYNALAEVQRRQGRINDAIKTLTQGIEVDPRDSVILNNLGMCWLMRGDYEKALDLFTQAAGIMPEKTRYRANMAVALAFLERDEEALSLYMQIMPDNSAEQNLQILKEGRQNKLNYSASLDM
jgi:tetratricopeptide (TPR) repeat protein